MKKLWILFMLILIGCTAKPIYYELPPAPDFRLSDKPQISLADGDMFLVEDASDDNNTKHTTGTDLKTYIDAGDVTGPASHLADYAPLWNGTPDSKTLLEGFLISAIGKLIAGDGNATAVRATIGAYGSGDAPVFATVNTGPGATEVHLQDQNLRTTDDVEFNSVNATTIRGVKTANPQIACTDSDCADGDTGFLITPNATVTGSGAEDYQAEIQAQRDGTMTTFIDIDAENDVVELGSETILTRAVGGLVGEIPVSLDTAATVTLVANDANGQARFNNDADVIQYDLPSVEAGLVILLYDVAGGVISVNPYDGTDTIYLNGTSVGAGDEIDSPGNVGDFICLMGIDATRWVTIGRSGSWIDGGAS